MRIFDIWMKFVTSATSGIVIRVGGQVAPTLHRTVETFEREASSRCLPTSHAESQLAIGERPYILERRCIREAKETSRMLDIREMDHLGSIYAIISFITQRPNQSHAYASWSQPYTVSPNTTGNSTSVSIYMLYCLLKRNHNRHRAPLDLPT
jgi:hypothetical protein